MTLPTGIATTVTDDDPDFPSLVAVIVAPPGDTPVTTPVVDTVATAVLLELHVTTRFVTTVPFKSLTVTESGVVFPVRTLAVAGETVTVPTGTGTMVTDAVPDFPSLIAVIVAVPRVTPVTTPVVDTVATAVLLDAHVTTRPLKTVPLASVSVAASVPVWPMMIELVAGETATLATGAGVTVIVEVPDFPSLVAVIVAVPGATPVTVPPDTVAIALLFEVQVTTRLVTTAPFTSFTVAVSVVVVVATTVAVVGDTVTLPTAAPVTVMVALPVLPSLVAVIVAEPVAIAVTTPALVTVATWSLLDVHVTTRFVTTTSFASFTVGCSTPVEPIVSVRDEGKTVTLPTGVAETVIAAVALWPAAVAVIVAVPTPIAFTVPSDATVATPVFELDQTIGVPVTTAPVASRVVAASCVVCATTIETASGVMTMLAAGPCVTLMVAASLFPSLVAVIVADPGATAVTIPFASTVATPALLVVQMIARSVRAF